MDACLCRLHRIVLVVDGRGRAGQVVDLIDFDVERERHIVTNQLETMVIEQVIDVAPHSGKEVVDTNDVATVREQALTEVRTEKASPTGNQYARFKMHVPDVLAVTLNVATCIRIDRPRDCVERPYQTSYHIASQTDFPVQKPLRRGRTLHQASDDLARLRCANEPATFATSRSGQAEHIGLADLHREADEGRRLPVRRYTRIGAGWIDDTAVTPLHPVRRASRRNDGLGRLMQIAALVPYCAMLRSFYSDFRSAAPMLTSGAFESRPTTSLIPGSSRSLWTIVSAIRAVRFATPSLL